jgi:hypothetical protein
VKATTSVLATTASSAYVLSDGLMHKGDRVHFDHASQIELGRRYAEALAMLP